MVGIWVVKKEDETESNDFMPLLQWTSTEDDVHKNQ